MLLAVAIPDTPAWVAKEMAKIEYKRREIEKGNLSFIRGNSIDEEESELLKQECKVKEEEERYDLYFMAYFCRLAFARQN